jgi:hypothetical protein
VERKSSNEYSISLLSTLELFHRLIDNVIRRVNVFRRKVHPRVTKWGQVFNLAVTALCELRDFITIAVCTPQNDQDARRADFRKTMRLALSLSAGANRIFFV